MHTLVGCTVLVRLADSQQGGALAINWVSCILRPLQHSCPAMTPTTLRWAGFEHGEQLDYGLKRLIGQLMLSIVSHEKFNWWPIKIIEIHASIGHPHYWPEDAACPCLYSITRAS
ncbi:hypothetical protein LX32DRAFT_639328 [Colletotrichum zoysiae]|uniref:Uncharacterized protein n=1 Tax=Colletotrichum zoysiae TaxID=1216348 RepID=A0AAD9M230_9PEZI|nr:hypothetical protein LX32DRAFT_639328 [Colletotrichum zoysiae]